MKKFLLLISILGLQTSLGFSTGVHVEWDKYSYNRNPAKFQERDLQWIPTNSHQWTHVTMKVDQNILAVKVEEPTLSFSHNKVLFDQDFTSDPDNLSLKDAQLRISNAGYVHYAHFQNYDDVEIAFKNSDTKLTLGGGSTNAITKKDIKNPQNIEDVIKIGVFIGQDHQRNPESFHHPKKTQGPIKQIELTPYYNRNRNYTAPLLGKVDYKKGEIDLYFKNIVPHFVLNDNYFWKK